MAEHPKLKEEAAAPQDEEQSDLAKISESLQMLLSAQATLVKVTAQAAGAIAQLAQAMDRNSLMIRDAVRDGFRDQLELHKDQIAKSDVLMKQAEEQRESGTDALSSLLNRMAPIGGGANGGAGQVPMTNLEPVTVSESKA